MDLSISGRGRAGSPGTAADLVRWIYSMPMSIVDEGANFVQVKESISALRGARERLTPVLMTTVVTAFGLLPQRARSLSKSEKAAPVKSPTA